MNLLASHWTGTTQLTFRACWVRRSVTISSITSCSTALKVIARLTVILKSRVTGNLIVKQNKKKGKKGDIVMLYYMKNTMFKGEVSREFDVISNPKMFVFQQKQNQLSSFVINYHPSVIKTID